MPTPFSGQYLRKCECTLAAMRGCFLIAACLVFACKSTAPALSTDPVLEERLGNVEDGLDSLDATLTAIHDDVADLRRIAAERHGKLDGAPGPAAATIDVPHAITGDDIRCEDGICHVEKKAGEPLPVQPEPEGDPVEPSRPPSSEADKPKRDPVRQGFGKANRAIASCGSEHGALPGTAFKVSFDVSSGRASNVEVQRPHSVSAFGRCVAQAVSDHGRFIGPDRLGQTQRVKL